MDVLLWEVYTESPLSAAQWPWRKEAGICFLPQSLLRCERRTPISGWWNSRHRHGGDLELLYLVSWPIFNLGRGEELFILAKCGIFILDTLSAKRHYFLGPGCSFVDSGKCLWGKDGRKSPESPRLRITVAFLLEKNRLNLHMSQVS